ncbi:MAG: amino acid--tRNA ligase-related protein, partial [Spirochaetota bacterium]
MFENRSYCGEMSKSDEGKIVTLCGWCDCRRDLGGVVFIELRDVSGIVQVVADQSLSSAALESADKVRSEYCLCVKGKIRRRTAENINPKQKTGEIEVVAESITILSESAVPPFPLEAGMNINEEVRLKYRYLDLRRPEMQHTIIARSKVMQVTRNYLVKNRFVEVEIPFLNKSTPEGARDFLVPSRINKGEFYALPQSPQTFKQIHMVAGFDRYFNIIKCFRDEDLRNDRQPEFTQ